MTGRTRGNRPRAEDLARTHDKSMLPLSDSVRRVPLTAHVCFL